MQLYELYKLYKQFGQIPWGIPVEAQLSSVKRFPF